MPMRSVVRMSVAVAGVFGVVLVAAGCSTTTAGSGREGAQNGSPSHDFPSASSAYASTSTATGSSAPGTTTAPATAPATATASTASTKPTQPSRAQATARLARLTPGQQLVVVAIPGGFEAISYDQAAHLGFWKLTSLDWIRAGTSTYPYSPAIGAPADAAAHGTLLKGMHDATFIVTGNFSGDGSGNAVAYTTGPLGWGAIKAEANGNIGPSGQPVGNDRIGLAFGFAFVGGRLETKDCPLNQPIAACGSNPVDKLWAWNGKDFSRI